MAHILRKYTSNRGSALFMVISTMTALIISCMAMYFTMVSANSAQYAVFGQMQATQTAESVLDIVRNSLNPYNSLNPDFQKKLLELEPGQSITTDANGFMALDPNIESGKTPAEIGAYSVTITCLSKEGEVGKDLKMEFDYLVMSSFNGSRDAIHFVQRYDESYEGDPNAGADGSGGDAELFAATGYVPNDAYINGGFYMTDVFYDTQYTYMNSYGAGGITRIATNLYTGGSMMLGSEAFTVVHDTHDDAYTQETIDKIGPVIWAIRGDFYPNFKDTFDMRGGSQVLVGGNMECAGMNQNSFQVQNKNYSGIEELGDHISIYVNGDLNYLETYVNKNIWLFVNGNVTGIKSLNDNSRLFVTGTEAERQAKTSTLSGVKVEAWPKSGDDFEDGLTYNDAIKLLDQKTATIAYYKWDLSSETNKADTQHVDIRLNGTNSDWTDDKGNTYEANSRNFIFAYPGSESEALVTGDKEIGAVGKSFVIDSVWTHEDVLSPSAIIIDTGDDPKNIMTIKLCDVTKTDTDPGTGEFCWFADREVTTKVIKWYPYEAEVTIGPSKPCLNAFNNQSQRLVLLKGRGTVLIDVPEGVTYTSPGYGVTGHIGWWLAMGGQIVEDAGHLKFTGVDPQNGGTPKSPTSVDHVHRTCVPGDGCSFELKEITDESAAKCIGCGGALTQVSCPVHGDVNKFCAKCYPEKKDRDDWCKNHVDNLKFAETYESLGDTEKAWVTDSKGIVYPTTNFMLVSCDESAEMLFSKSKDGTTISYNHFFGFIYAPYMTYLSSKSAAGAITVKLCGGMTVGDYTLQSDDTYIGCYPDHMPNELAGMAGGGSMAGGKLSGVTKNWKITLGGYT